MLGKIPPEIKDAIPGAVGAAVALRWLQGGLVTKAVLFVGGCAVAFWGTAPVAAYFELPSHAHGLIGLLLGMFSMMIASRILHGLSVLDLGKFFTDLLEIIKRKIGGGGQ